MIIYHFLTILSQIYNTHIYEALFVLLFLEEAGVPLPTPGDLYIFLAGTQVVSHKANPILIVLDVTIATILGGSLLFWIIKTQGEPLVKKYGKYILVNQEKLERGQRWFDKYGEIVILVGRWVPGLRIVLTIVAGLFDLEYIKFIIAITISTIVWASAYLFAGVIYSKYQYKLLLFFKEYNISTTYLIYFGLTVLTFLFFYFILRRYKKRTD